MKPAVLPLVLVSSLGSRVSSGYLTGDFQGLEEISSADLWRSMGTHPQESFRVPCVIKAILQVLKNVPAFV